MRSRLIGVGLLSLAACSFDPSLAPSSGLSNPGQPSDPASETGVPVDPPDAFPCSTRDVELLAYKYKAGHRTVSIGDSAAFRGFMLHFDLPQKLPVTAGAAKECAFLDFAPPSGPSVRCAYRAPEANNGFFSSIEHLPYAFVECRAGFFDPCGGDWHPPPLVDVTSPTASALWLSLDNRDSSYIEVRLELAGTCIPL